MLNLFPLVIYLRISLSLTLPPDFHLWAYLCTVLLYLVSFEHRIYFCLFKKNEYSGVMVPCPWRLDPCKERIVFLVLWLKHKKLCLCWLQEGRQYLVKHKICWGKTALWKCSKTFEPAKWVCTGSAFHAMWLQQFWCGGSLKLDILLHRTMPLQNGFCSVHSPAKTGTEFAVTDPEKFWCQMF